MHIIHLVCLHIALSTGGAHIGLIALRHGPTPPIEPPIDLVLDPMYIIIVQCIIAHQTDYVDYSIRP
jgi:hypothetical protein